MRGGEVVHALVERNNVGKMVVNANDDFVILILDVGLLLNTVYSNKLYLVPIDIFFVSY